MKKIIFVRHAKSSWKYNVSDDKRPLKKRGLKDAILVSKVLKNSSFYPDLIVSSHANRALTTCEIFIKTLQIDKNILQISEEMYDFGGQRVMSIIKNLDDKYKNVMLFGHNHAFTHLVNLLGNEFIDNLPTSGLVMINFKEDNWENIQKGTTELTIFPRDLKD